jgi:hypothetical protein
MSEPPSLAALREEWERKAGYYDHSYQHSLIERLFARAEALEAKLTAALVAHQEAEKGVALQMQERAEAAEQEAQERGMALDVVRDQKEEFKRKLEVAERRVAALEAGQEEKP